MRTEKVSVILMLGMALLLSSCTCLKTSKGKYHYRFTGERTTKTNVAIMAQREIYTSLHVESEPAGASVYAYDSQKSKKEQYLGKTPLDYSVMSFNINDYADRTKGYWVNLCLPYEVTRDIDFSNPENASGEFTFSFYLALKGYKSEIEQVKVKATHEVLLNALEGQPLPTYELKVNLEEQ